MIFSNYIFENNARNFGDINQPFQIVPKCPLLHLLHETSINLAHVKYKSYFGEKKILREVIKNTFE